MGTRRAILVPFVFSSILLGSYISLKKTDHPKMGTPISQIRCLREPQHCLLLVNFAIPGEFTTITLVVPSISSISNSAIPRDRNFKKYPYTAITGPPKGIALVNGIGVC